jgi:hypothetical protein
MATDVTKPWKRKFFEVKDIKDERISKAFIKPAQHGLLKKEKGNANKHS